MSSRDMIITLYIVLLSTPSTTRGTIKQPYTDHFHLLTTIRVAFSSTQSGPHQIHQSIPVPLNGAKRLGRFTGMVLGFVHINHMYLNP